MIRLPHLALALALAPTLAVAAGTPALAATARLGGGDAAERLRDADTNGDGAVSRPEMLAMRQSQWSRFDRNGDGYFSQADLPGFARDRWNGDKLARLRQAFDQNRDGRISRAEYVDGPTPAFDMADADNNGLVTRAEFQSLAELAGK
ncbi:EF-hand domain-containing protein [Novosphingobium album (ex Liu et al. 2023)]|uniref:EF-hand domain-containing protein n=1 Tax=Novosphingobium album (ex Liu et al. 2023) TaxID=3031130 RepID=A0ABT5WMJ8_9SPHN|nr:EF-hand domain-containing protein [Novosphingobium album (ex Liu et al. 2023)]MDE8651256.1 EF-hand domain-containing protein [Novosphingobium album (ex Liu et al. 2023)]